MSNKINLIDIKLLRNDPYGTHQPVLVELIKNTSGNIIEFGCGNSSTVLIRKLIKDTDRKLVSLESNLEWFNKFKDLETENHKLFYIDAGNDDTDETGIKWINFLNNNEYIRDMNFDICFIDQSPWTARTHTLKHYINSCKYIIVHDVDYFPNAGKWGQIINKIKTNNNKLNKFNMDFSDISKHYKIYYPPEEFFAGDTGPPTLLCSNLTTDTEFNNMISLINIDKYYSLTTL